MSTPTMNGSTVPRTRAIAPMTPAVLARPTSTSKAVATIAKSRNIAPPIRPIPASTGMSASPFSPPVLSPLKNASARPNRIAMAEPWIRPTVKYFDRIADSHMRRPTNAKAVSREFAMRTWSSISMLSSSHLT